MLRKIPLESRPKHGKSSSVFERLQGLNLKYGLFWVTLGVFLFALFLYGVLAFGNSSSIVRYSPSDVVYGNEFRAVHDMNSAVNAKLPSISYETVSAIPKIQMSEYFYDFGSVNSHEILSRTFVIANIGNVKLVIEKAYTTCGCTVADFTAKEIPPGKVALMTIHFDTGFHDMRGTTVRRGVVLETNNPEQPVQEIWIQASVR